MSGSGSLTGTDAHVGMGGKPKLASRHASQAPHDQIKQRSGPHLAAIRASVSQNFFSESMFVRFVVHEVRGTWKGRVYSDDVLRPAA